MPESINLPESISSSQFHEKLISKLLAEATFSDAHYVHLPIGEEGDEVQITDYLVFDLIDSPSPKSEANMKSLLAENKACIYLQTSKEPRQWYIIAKPTTLKPGGMTIMQFNEAGCGDSEKIKIVKKENDRVNEVVGLEQDQILAEILNQV